MVSIKEEEEDESNNHQEEKEEETKPQMESESSPLRSPHQSHLPPTVSFSQRQPPPPPPSQHENLSQIIAKDRRIHGFSPLRSPSHDNKKHIQLHSEPTPEPIQLNPLSPVIVVNRSIREELSVVSKVDPVGHGYPDVGAGLHGGGGGGRGRTRGDDVEGGGGDRRSKTVSSILWKERREAMIKRAALGFRVFAVVFCLISFSVMAADKTQGWAGDSFDRYKEYSYCLSVTVIGFVYAGFQMINLAYHLSTGRHFIKGDIRCYFDFCIDQILTYLLISASSAGASRVDDWQSNWGKDDFTVMASASIGMSFLAFVAFAFNSLISGYNLCTRSRT